MANQDQFKLNNRGFSTLIAILIVVVLAVVVGGIVIWQQKELEKATTIPEIKLPEKTIKEEVKETIEDKSEEITQEEVANWKTYRDEKYGFEIKYPNNCRIDISGGHQPWREELLGRVSIIPKEDRISNDLDSYIDIQLIDAKYYLNLNDYIGRFKDRIFPIDESLSIDSSEVKIYKFSESFFIYLKNKDYIFNIYSPSKEFLIKLLSTFKFIK